MDGDALKMSIHYFGEDSTWDDGYEEGYEEGYDDGYDEAKLILTKKHKEEIAILMTRIETLKNSNFPLFAVGPKESSPGDE